MNDNNDLLFKIELEKRTCELLKELKKYNIFPKKVFYFGSVVEKLGGKSRKPFRLLSDIDIGLQVDNSEEFSKVLSLPIFGESCTFGRIHGHRVEITPFDQELDEELIKEFFVDIKVFDINKCQKAKK